MCNVENKNPEGYIFDFEKLQVYKGSLQFVKNIFKISSDLPRNYQFSIGDQIRRAALPIVNNIAEGSGKIYKKGKSQFYRISLNSARECIPMLTLLEQEKIVGEEYIIDLRKKCIYICNMLGKLIYSLN
ncbi:MAG: four helix bundle protein [Candidatus Omnitrophota bacterium]